MKYSVENLGGGIKIYCSPEHSFGTDSFLLSHFAKPRKSDAACDLCTGCGIVPLLWMRDENAPKSVHAVDVAQQAIDQLTQSVQANALQQRLVPVHADLCELHGKLAFSSFDLVTCNPPYKAAGAGILSRSASDQIARHELLCTMDDCCKTASKLLKFGGRFCVCQLPERLVDVLTLMRAHKIEPKRIRFVQKDSASAPWLVLVEGKRGAKPFLKAEPALLLYEDGATSAEMLAVYSQFGNIIRK